MKNKIFHKKFGKGDDFRQFKAKMVLRTVLMMMVSLLAVMFMYSFFLAGHFANWIVAVYQKLFRLDFKEARSLYQWTFRNYAEYVYLIAIIIMFAAVFRVYLNWYTKYFAQINEGMDSLIQEEAGAVSLAPELLPIERKMNAVRHTIARQKSDILEAEQRKNDLIMYLAHDLKTPLASVIGYLNLLHDGEEIPEELRQKYLSVTLDKAEHLEDLINEFFEIAKYNLSNITLQYSKINLARLFEMLLYEFGPMLQEKNLTCSLHIAENTMLRCDADKMQRVFDNLLRNAVNYSYEGTGIEITVSEQDEKLTIQFVNHGDTIPREKLERLFEQFYRLDASRSTGSGGVGLGLAIARQIVELHGGIITAQSAENKITFVIEMPAAKD